MWSARASSLIVSQTLSRFNAFVASQQPQSAPSFVRTFAIRKKFYKRGLMKKRYKNPPLEYEGEPSDVVLYKYNARLAIAANYHKYRTASNLLYATNDELILTNPS